MIFENKILCAKFANNSLFRLILKSSYNRKWKLFRNPKGFERNKCLSHSKWDLILSFSCETFSGIEMFGVLSKFNWIVRKLKRFDSGVNELHCKQNLLRNVLKLSFECLITLLMWITHWIVCQRVIYYWEYNNYWPKCSPEIMVSLLHC